jgi:hypothetical protein
MPEYFKKPSSAACPGASCAGCSDAMCMSEGGAVWDGKHREDNEKGVHSPLTEGSGISGMGVSVRAGDMEGAKKQSIDNRREQRPVGHQTRTELYAEGGEVEGPEVEDEIHNMLGDELMEAFESKDRKRVMEGLEALVMSCMNKRGES